MTGRPDANILALLMLFGWIPFTAILFGGSKSRSRAVVVAYVAGWLLLPTFRYPFQGLPDLGKTSVTSLGVLIGVGLFDSGRALGFKFAAIDLPMAVWCLCPLASSLSNDLGAWDGWSGVWGRVLFWGVPYLMGRLYLTSRKHLLLLVKVIIVGALAYVPIILMESRLSAQLHRWVYGVPTRAGYEYVGYFGPLRWKPAGFMNTAFEVSLYMVVATIGAVWLWRAGERLEIGRLSLGACAAILVPACILCKTVTGWILLTLGLLCGHAVLALRRHALILACLSFPWLYVAARLTGVYTGEEVTRLREERGEEVFRWDQPDYKERRARSLQFRIYNETLLIPKALERPLLGWGGWGGAAVYNEEGQELSVFDGLWIIVLGQNGLVGLAALYGALGLPVVFLLCGVPKGALGARAWAATGVLATSLALQGIDTVPNAFPAPYLLLGLGGIAGLVQETMPRARGIARGGGEGETLECLGRG